MIPRSGQGVKGKRKKVKTKKEIVRKKKLV